MFYSDTGGQVRTADQIYDYLWFIAGLAIGIVSLVITALLSDKTKKVPQ
jgi:cobalamin biosynthesis protein CbiG